MNLFGGREVLAFQPVMRGTYPIHPEPPRPDLLGRALKGYQEGRLERRDLERAFRRGMVEAVAEQVVAGLEMVGDGFIHWDGPIFYLLRRLKGFWTPDDRRWQRLEEMGGEDKGLRSARVVDRVEWIMPILRDDYLFLSERSPVPVRVGLTGPYSIARMVDPGTYGEDLNSLTLDLAEALNRELKELERVGAEWVIVEEPLVEHPLKDKEGFVEASCRLSEGVNLTLMVGVIGSIIGLEEVLCLTPYQGLAIDLQNVPQNEGVLEEGEWWEGRILELGLVNGADQRVESGMEVGVGLLKFARRHPPELLWAGPTGSLGHLSRDRAFLKLKNLVEGVQWARRMLGQRREEF